MIAGEYQGFEVEIREGGVALVTLTRPERMNAMTVGVRRDLVEVLTMAQLDDEVRVLVITATGRGFCAGMYLVRDGEPELPTLAPPRPDARREPINLYGQLRLYSQELTRAVRRLDKLTIAAVNGYAIQIGFSLALACDFVVAAQSARLGSGTLRMGYQPDEGGHWLLVEHLGVKRALDFMMNKRIVDASDALALGLVNEVVADDVLLEHSLAKATELAAGPQVAVRLLKRAIYNAAHLTFEQAGEDIAVRTAISDFHRDAREGEAAWLRHDTAVFNRWLDDD